MAVEHVNTTIKSYSIRVSRERDYLLGLIPLNKFRLLFNIVQTYDDVRFDNDNFNSKGCTIINHNVESIVDWYYTLEEAETALPHWEMNVATKDISFKGPRSVDAHKAA